MAQDNQFFATARPSRLFFMVALPGLVSMLAMSLYQIAEGAFIGQTLGTSAFAAVNLAFPVIMINFALADLIGVGSSAPIAVALGRGDRARANNIFTCSLIMIVGTGALMGAVMCFASPLFVRLMGADGELARQAVNYVRLYAVFSPLTTVVFATDNYLRISGFVKTSMFINLLSAALTVGFLALFLGVMRRGVEFSALSSCLALLICAVLAMIPFFRGKAVLKLTRPHFSVSLVRDVVTFGAPTFLNNISGRVTAILMNAALLRMGGETAVAAYAVLMYASGVVEPMLYGLCDSVQPAIGYNWGAGRLDRVRDIAKVAFLSCGLLSLVCSGVMLLLPEVFAFLFVDAADTALWELSVHAMSLFGYAFVFGWFSFAVQGFFASVERPIPATVISICKAMVFPVLLIFLLEPMELDGLWLNYAGASVLTGLLAVALLIPAQKRMKRDCMIPREEEVYDHYDCP